MINEFLDWTLSTSNAFVLLVLILASVALMIVLGAMFVQLAAPPELIRFAFLMFVIDFAIFITWYFKEYRK